MPRIPDEYFSQAARLMAEDADFAAALRHATEERTRHFRDMMVEEALKSLLYDPLPNPKLPVDDYNI